MIDNERNSKQGSSMNTNTIKQNGETIIRVIFTEGMTSQEIADTYLNSVQLVCAEQSTRPVFRIFDVRQAGSHASMIATEIAEMTKGLVGASIYPQTNMAIVGQPSFANPTAMPLFYSIDAALAHIESLHLSPAA